MWFYSAYLILTVFVWDLNNFLLLQTFVCSLITPPLIIKKDSLLIDVVDVSYTTKNLSIFVKDYILTKGEKRIESSEVRQKNLCRWIACYKNDEKLMIKILALQYSSFIVITCGKETLDKRLITKTKKKKDNGKHNFLPPHLYSWLTTRII